MSGVDLEAIYLRAPVALQNALCSAQGWRIQRTRYDRGFHEALDRAERRSRWSTAEVIAFRDAEVRRVVRDAALHVPHYRELVKARSIPVHEVRGLDDLARWFPVLTKDEVKARPEAFVSERVPASRHRIAHTSGTTGGGLRFATDADAERATWACWWRYRRWHGIDLDTWCGYFGGRSLVPLAQTRGPFWRVNAPGRQVMFSAYHMTAANLDAYLVELARARVPWLHGYPSLLSLLAEHAIARGHDLRGQIRWVTTGAENLLAAQREVIARAFGVAPVEHYGQAEAVANVSQCTEGKLHVDEDFAGVELAPHEAGPARVVGTSFVNAVTPLLRYDTQDLATAAPEGATCACGRPGRLVEALDGRREDYVVLASGARVGRMDHIFKDLVRVREAQVVQDRAGEVVFRVVKGDGYTPDDEAQLLSEARRRLGDDTALRVDYVDAVPRTRSGKLRLVVSSLREGQLTGG